MFQNSENASTPIYDFAIRNDVRKPYVVGVLIKIQGSFQWVGAEQIDWTEHPLRFEHSNPWTSFPPGVFPLKKRLLWKIGLDLKHQRPTRVVNYELTYEQNKLVLHKVFFGWRGLLTLFAKKWVRWKQSYFLTWDQFQPFLDPVCQPDYQKMDWFYPADIADMLRMLPFTYQLHLISGLKPVLAANTMIELEAHFLYPILDRLPAEKITSLLSLMPSNHASAILREYKDPEKIVRLIPPPLQDKIRLQLGYDPGTAGAWMDTDYFTFSSKSTCAECLSYLREHPLPPEGIFYIYIEDEQKEFIGVVSIRSVIMSAPETLLETLMKKNLITLSVQTSKYEVANIMSRYHFLALPVVDENKRIVGVIKIHDVLASTLEYPV